MRIYGAITVKRSQAGIAYTALAPTMWATHDGGEVWTAQRLPSATALGQVEDVEAANGVVHAMVMTGANYRAVVDNAPDRNGFVAQDERRHVEPARGRSPAERRHRAEGRKRLARLRQRPRHELERAPREFGHVGEVDAAVRVGRQQLRATRRHESVRSGGALHDGRIRLRPLEVGATGCHARLELALPLDRRRIVLSGGLGLKPVKDFPAFSNFSGLLASPRSRVYLVGSDVNQHQGLVASLTAAFTGPRCTRARSRPSRS